MGDTEQPLISIIISTGGSPWISDCIKACQMATESISAEILLVIDKGAELGDLSFLPAGKTSVRLFLSNEPGVTGSRNCGLEMARGRHFLLLDEDCLPPSAEMLKKVIARSEQSGALGGGTYSVAATSPYFARVYNQVNQIWLRAGRLRDGSSLHLLGGFLFGPRELIPLVRFDGHLLWGGEEKELLRRLRREHNLKAFFHPDLSVIHLDRSGFEKFYRRAMRQGIAAGAHSLNSRPSLRDLRSRLLPGLVLFYSLSRMGIFIGRYKKLKGKVNRAYTSPKA